MDSGVLNDTFSFTIDDEKKIFTIIGNENISLNTIIEAFSSAKQISEKTRNYKIMADLRTVNFHPTFDEILTIKNRITTEKDSLNSKIALVTGQKISILAQLVSAFSNAISIKMKAFMEISDAENWLLQRN